ncbi:MAG TPA: DUF2652 domain-containing protein, partial [Candidatus Binatia bacterium]|nr:DUF2652 domain-containing protein [Candidatus Binatia bacterium]
GVELDHAQDILADLISTVATALRPTFRLAKLEGDAAFVVAPAERIDASLLLDTIERCYFGFRRRRRDVRQATSCECDACVRIPDLDLKFVIHSGQAIRQRIAGWEELVGADVIVVHRLLKNSVVEETGIRAYALFSDAAVRATDLRPDALGMRPHRETYEAVGEIAGWVEDLEARWRDEEDRQRVIVKRSEAMYTVEIPTVAPPQLAWEFVTTPGRRTGWQAGVTGVEGIGDRRGVGAANHCMHGKDVIVEEILDWRPYDYVTLRSTMPTPGGPVKFLTTIEFEPTADGTIVRQIHAAPKTAKERAIFTQMGPFFEGLFEQSSRALRAALEAAVEERLSEGPQAALPAAREGGAAPAVRV